ncbi:MAG: response regulator [Gemmatimonadales bacterium]|nr:response regulator [Gemmatimonadales bacterium]
MKILVLEHSPLARRIIRDELLPSGYEILEAETVQEAHNILASIPGICLITTGVATDEGDGFEFIKNLRSAETVASLKPLKNHAVPAILVTSNDTDEDRLKGYQVGAADFIQKPWQRDQLLGHVNSVLGQDDELAGMSVLVADDSPTARTFVSNCLSRLGVTIHEVDDGDTAYEFLKGQSVDMVVTDLKMERMDGDILCLKIRGELGLKKLPVIFLSASEDKGTILSLFKLGATDYLMKPFLQEELMARLKVHLERAKLMQALKDDGISIPGAANDSAESHSQSKYSVNQDGHSRPLRILVVDDGPVNLLVNQKLLQSLGCQVITASDGSIAVPCFQTQLNNNEPFDMVFMDLMMPEVSGLEATRRIRAIEKALPFDHPGRSNPVPIIALTAQNPEGLQDDCLEAGLSDFLVKPVQEKNIHDMIQRWTSVLV